MSVDCRILATGILVAANGCFPSVGLRPLDPKPVIPQYTPWATVPQVESLTPMLIWQTFPRARDLERLGASSPAQVTNVRYELMLWRQSKGSAGDPNLVVATNLTTPRYAIVVPLIRGCVYRWRVRARFELDGKPRLTPWSQAGSLAEYEPSDSTAFAFRTPGKGGRP